VKKKRVKRRKKCRQGWEGGGRNRKRREDRKWMRRRWRKLGRGQGRKKKGVCSKNERETGVEEIC